MFGSYFGFGSRFLFSVRVRYAPSPTGPMHLGAVRTALFNYLFAVRNNGKFILRIQDTDQTRNVQNGKQDIINTLEWLGIAPHQSFKVDGKFGPYIQSQRLDLYKQVQGQLLKNGYAYPCFCEQSTPKTKQQKTYDGKCRKLSLQQIKTKIRNGEKYVIRIKSDIQQLQINTFNDQVYGTVAANPFDDFIIVKSNRFPTYHFANVLDDWKMGITHVIRGEEWLTNTPKHIYLYGVLGVKPPTFMHLPLITTPDGKKLSKRDPTAPVQSLISKGYQPEAIINYTGLLGFNPNKSEEEGIPVENKEYFTLQELTSEFQAHRINNSPIRWDPSKLNYFNRHYIRLKFKNKNVKLRQQMRGFLRKFFNLAQNLYSDDYLEQVIGCVVERLNNYEDLKNYGHFFKQPQTYDPKDIRIMFGKTALIVEEGHQKRLSEYDQELLKKYKFVLHNLRLIFEHVLGPDEFVETKIAEKISQFLFDNQTIKNQDAYHLLRLAVTGKKSGVNIVKTCVIIGRQRVQNSLRNFHQIIAPAQTDFAQ